MYSKLGHVTLLMIENRQKKYFKSNEKYFATAKNISVLLCLLSGKISERYPQFSRGNIKIASNRVKF